MTNPNQYFSNNGIRVREEAPLKIAHIIPGSGGSFYCGNCLRDSKLFDALRRQGHDAIKIPMYLPLFSHDTDQGMTPVFYGAISLYLKQRFPLFRHAPEWVDRLLNARPMLKLAAGMANSTRATGLEEMTVSMLMGEQGLQNQELDKLVHWLETHFRPDVVHLSNALLVGMARRLRERLGVPVVCSLQDEHVWVDVMRPAFARQVWALMQERAADIDRFLSVSRYYTGFMKGRLGLTEDKITTLHLGIDPDDYHYVNASEKPRTIGFLSRMCRENGLDILVDAFLLLKQRPGHQDVGLLLTGGQTADDGPFLKEQKQKVAAAGLEKQVTFLHDFEQEERTAFFDRVMLLSVPVRGGEAFGIYMTEAMAAGIPVVQPAVGAFPEIVEASGGGMTYPENDPGSLAEALEQLLADPSRVEALSRQARLAAEGPFNIHGLATRMTGTYRQVVAASGGEGPGTSPAREVAAPGAEAAVKN
jgi:glycosyltransferase involved in cell wall biosynthesis